MSSQTQDNKPAWESELSALRRAIAVERRSHYADFQGKRSTFSQFMRQTAERLCRRYPHQSTWVTVRALYRQYPNLDVATRIAIVRRTEELIAQAPGNANGYASGYANGYARHGAQASAKTSEQAPVETKRPITPPAPQTPQKNLAEAEGKTTSEPATAERKVQAPVAKQFPKNGEELNEIAVQFVRGVGPRLAATLEKLGITTVLDLLKHYPRRHLDFQNRVQIGDLQVGQEATIFATVRTVGAFQSRNRNISVITITLTDATGSITVTRFIGGKSNKFLLDRFKSQWPKGAQVMASGLVERDRMGNKLTLKNAEIEILGGAAIDEDGAVETEPVGTLHMGRLVPVYALTEGLSLRYLRTVIHNALEAYGHLLKDPIPEPVKRELQLVDLTEAIKQIHFPEDNEKGEAARRRLVFDELFAIQLQLAHRRHQFDITEGALALKFNKDGLVKRLIDSLPFTLTNAQRRVFGEIASDLSSSKPMHRLVQGDVGSGKTVVALMSFLVAVENGFQGAMMAPTEILAEQHYRQFVRLLTPLGLGCALVLGKQGSKERKEVRQKLFSGQAHIAVGTHALSEDDVEFQNLGLIIIDEQHRFGVKQRARLKAKSLNPELLTMTATPIPRTLALGIHGDLDISEIDEMPPGRKPIKTKLLKPSQRKELNKFIEDQVHAGRQAYIVFPLIEESESLAAKAATQEFEKLKSKIFPDLKIGLMHGKLLPKEKDEVMEAFRRGEYQILVSTTVIEVGVDVPNATVMVIENADRFGLAQLHQLRGRVGRGGDQSHCFLISESRAQQTRERLNILEQTNDGFVVAEKDLEIRGPGEFIGFRQSGLPDLVLADLVKDAKILEEARKQAIEIIKLDPELQAFPTLKTLLTKATSLPEAEIMRSG